MARNVRKIALTGADQVIRSKQCRLVGFAIRNGHASDAVNVLIYDDASSAAGTVIPVSVVAGESAREWWADAGEDIEGGVLMENGIFVDKDGTGTFTGCLFVVD